MVRKKLAVVVAALGTLQAGMVSALGLGDFSLNSALNQPLDAEIQLLNTRDLDPSQVIVRLAPADDFKNAGVVRDFFLTNLKFSVVLKEDGTGVIKITSHDSVVEPYLDFLVEARWPSGRLLREYTVLLDLPVYSESQPTAVQPAQIQQQAAPVAAPAPVATRVDSASSRQTLNQGELTAGESYRVQQSDTLWEIAAKARPNNQVSIQQTMLGIQRLNPNAFIKGNINNLKAGYVLRLPTESQIQDVSAQSAVNQVASQNRQWKTGESPATSDSDSDSGAQLDATGSTTSSSDQAANEARLSLGSGGSSDSSAVGDGSGVSAEGLQALQQELDQAKEGLDETGRENEELQSRLQDMEARIATLQRLLELKDDQLASMQGGVVEGEQAAEAADTVADTEEAEAVAAPVETEAVAVEPEQEVPDVAQTPEPVAPELGLVDRVLANPLYAGAGLVLLVLIVLLVMRRRQSQADEAEIEAVDDIEFEPSLDEESIAEESVDAPEVEASDDIADMDLDVGDFGTDLDEFEEPVIEEAVEAPAAVEPASIQPETGDAIAEADIYIAYGRYQQAIDLLSAAVAQDSQRSDLQVKLMEVYLETRDKPGFQQQYSSLQALGDDAAIVQVKEMLSTVDGVSDWLDGMGTAAAAITDEDMDAELIEGEEQDLLLDLDGGEVELELDDTEVELDLDLDEGDLDLDNDADLTLEVPAADSGVGELGDDFDLDLDEGSLDELSSSETIQFDAVDLEDASASDLGDLQLDDLELGGDDEIELVLDGDNAFDEAPEPEVVEEPVASEAADDVQEDDGFDLDLDSDFDLDLDDLSASVGELDDLEAEFDGGSNTELDVVAEEQPAIELDSEPAVEPTAEESEVVGEFDDLDLSAELDLGGDEADELEDFDVAVVDEIELPEESQPAAEDAEDDDDFDFLADTDEVATKLDLARAYIDMGDTEGAKDILDEVAQEGSDEQKQEASALLERID